MTNKFLGARAPHPLRNMTFASTLGLAAWLVVGCAGGDGGGGSKSPATTKVPTGSSPDGGTGGVGATLPVDASQPGLVPPTTAGGTASAKFCNGLRSASGSIEFVLQVGNPPVTFTAASGSCSPPAGQACSAVQAGDAIPVSLSLNGMTIGQGQFMIPAGQDVVFEPELTPNTNGGQSLDLVGSVYQPGTCPNIDLVDIGDGGAPPDHSRRRPATPDALRRGRGRFALGRGRGRFAPPPPSPLPGRTGPGGGSKGPISPPGRSPATNAESGDLLGRKWRRQRVRQSASMASMTAVVRAPLTPVLGLWPRPRSWSTTVSISGCCT